MSCWREVVRWLAPVALLALSLPQSASAQRRSATIVGVVRDSSGFPIPDVEVAVTGSGLRSRSDVRGMYRIAGLLAGPATLTARRLGFASYSWDLRLEGGETRTFDIRLVGSDAVLSGIDVVAPREVYDSRLAGFNARSKLHVGHFVTRERIDRANSATLTDLLREMPGVRIGTMRNQGRAIRMRGADCPPLVFVDGFPASAAEFDVDMVDLRSVEGIEVYSGSSSIPPEFSGPRDLDRCGVIAIWSRPARPRARRPDESEHLADSGAVAARRDVYERDRVEVVAQLDSGSGVPAYPDSLYRSRVAGRVVVEFIVDTLGAVEGPSVDVLASSDPLFTLAVREALASAHFSPARLAGRRVRQSMQVPFVFAVPPPSDRQH